MTPEVPREQTRSAALQAGTGWRGPRRQPICVPPMKRRSSPRASEPLAGLRLGVDLAEAVRQEDLQRNVLLADEPARRQLAAREQIEHGADRGRRGDLDGAQDTAVHVAAVNLVGVGLLNQLAAVAAADGDE